MRPGRTLSAAPVAILFRCLFWRNIEQDPTIFVADLLWAEVSLVEILTEGKLVCYTMIGDEGHILTWLTDLSWVEFGQIHDHISWYDWMMCHEKVETYKQCCRSRFIESGSGYGSGSSILDAETWFWWPKIEKNTAEIFFFFLYD